MKGLIAAIVVALLLIPALAVAQSREDYDPDEAFVSDPQGTVPPFAPTAVLWDNGPLATCTGCGAGGADESALQNVSQFSGSLQGLYQKPLCWFWIQNSEICTGLALAWDCIPGANCYTDSWLNRWPICIHYDYSSYVGSCCLYDMGG